MLSDQVRTRLRMTLIAGIQVDVSMNNVSATASTQFIQQRISETPVLRPLTMVLKQWLFQRKMNEVYLRGGLSSYALFLLVLTGVHQHNIVDTSPANEVLGRYLLQFLRQWGAPTAFSAIIRPLKGPEEKQEEGWEDVYQPFSMCIQPPVSSHSRYKRSRERGQLFRWTDIFDQGDTTGMAVES